jgi:hypothetical protein
VEMANVAVHLEDSDAQGDWSTGGPIWGPASSLRAPPTAEERTQGDGGSRKKLAVARRRTTRRSVPARHRGRSRKGQTVEKRRWKGPECNNGIKDREARRQLRLTKERTSCRIFRKTVELEIEERIVGSSNGLREMSDWIF